MFKASEKGNQGAVGVMKVLPSTGKFITYSKIHYMKPDIGGAVRDTFPREVSIG